ncbi:hypothetical protein TNCV_2802961 [Trichonephila clavipes]|nr:hypothetical protein TNCV_2802961 [Trichonephila clavipes]
MKETVLVLGTSCRRDETIIARLRGGHTRAQWHVKGLKPTSNPIASKHAFAIPDGSSNDTASFHKWSIGHAYTSSYFHQHSKMAIVHHCGSELSPSVSSSSAEQGIFCLEAISPIPLNHAKNEYVEEAGSGTIRLTTHINNRSVFCCSVRFIHTIITKINITKGRETGGGRASISCILHRAKLKLLNRARWHSTPLPNKCVCLSGNFASDHWIGQRGLIDFPARLPDLTPPLLLAK